MTDNPEGREALVHLRVPAATKARWVRESRAAGMRLTDWIIERVERAAKAPMNVFKVPDSLASKYHGAGHALAATVNGQLVDIIYIHDVLPDYAGFLDKAGLRQAIHRPELAPTVRHLQALGQVHIGMLSCWEFCEL